MADDDNDDVQIAVRKADRNRLTELAKLNYRTQKGQLTALLDEAFKSRRLGLGPDGAPVPTVGSATEGE